MAKSAAVWGIDIGRCALKAMRCHLDGDAVVADGFDYIEYPKLLTQPEADAPQLIKEAPGASEEDPEEPVKPAHPSSKKRRKRRR